MADHDNDPLLPMTAQIAAAFLSRNDAEAEDIPALLAKVYSGLRDAPNAGQGAVTTQKPAVPIEDSVTDEVIICLEDGLAFKSLKRHLRTKFEMTPEAYREKWGLPHDYPMVAPAYARKRSKLAKKMGLGKS